MNSNFHFIQKSSIFIGNIEILINEIVISEFEIFEISINNNYYV